MCVCVSGWCVARVVPRFFNCLFLCCVCRVWLVCVLCVCVRVRLVCCLSLVIRGCVTRSLLLPASGRVCAYVFGGGGVCELTERTSGQANAPLGGLGGSAVCAPHSPCRPAPQGGEEDGKYATNHAINGQDGPKQLHD